jgi:pyruvate-formate lyase-activating enzyme
MSDAINLSDFSKTNEIIFYGGGGWLLTSFGAFLQMGVRPVCIADSSETKQGTKLCGYEIKSLSDAFKLYPNAYILVTVEPKKSNGVINYLIENCRVSADIIVNLKLKEYRSCAPLQKHIVIAPSNIRLCCRTSDLNKFPVVFTDEQDLSGTVEKLQNLKQDLLSKLKNNTPCICDGCQEIMVSHWIDFDSTKISTVCFAGTYGCNAKCIYCTPHLDEALSPFSNERMINKNSIKIFDILESNGYISPGAFIDFADSEITVHKNKEEYFNIAHRYNCNMITNGIIYNSEIEKICTLEFNRLLVSLDCGTRQTFYNIKGVDKFNDVIENLKRYKSASCNIVLKYIVLDGINDNTAEADAFLDVCKTIEPLSMFISMDIYKDYKELGKNTKETIEYLQTKAKLMGIPAMILHKIS